MQLAVIDILIFFLAFAVFVQGMKMGWLMGIMSSIALVVGTLSILKIFLYIAETPLDDAGSPIVSLVTLLGSIFIGYTLVRKFMGLFTGVVGLGASNAFSQIIGGAMALGQLVFLLNMAFWLFDKAEVLPEEMTEYKETSRVYEYLGGEESNVASQVMHYAGGAIPWFDGLQQNIETVFQESRKG